MSNNALELAKALAEKARHKEHTIKVSKKFIGDFNKVAAHYRCDLEEVKIMKECAKADIETAKICFDSLAKEIEE